MYISASLKMEGVTDSHKMEGILKHVKWRGLQLQGPLYIHHQQKIHATYIWMIFVVVVENVGAKEDQCNPGHTETQCCGSLLALKQ